MKNYKLKAGTLVVLVLLLTSQVVLLNRQGNEAKPFVEKFTVEVKDFSFEMIGVQGGKYSKWCYGHNSEDHYVYVKDDVSQSVVVTRQKYRISI